LTRAGKMFLF